MKHLILLFLIASITSCIETPKNIDLKESDPNHNDNKTASFLSNQIINDIELYYINEIQNYYPNLNPKVEQEITDSEIIITFSYTIDETLNGIVSIYLSDDNCSLCGDLNKDGLEDRILQVVYESPDLIGMNFQNHYFTYINKNNTLELAHVTRDVDMFKCVGHHFYAENISEGLLIGTSTCLDENDGRHAPSLETKTKLAFQKKSLVFVNNNGFKKIKVE